MPSPAQIAALADYAKARQGRVAAERDLLTTLAAAAETRRGLEQALTQGDALRADMLKAQLAALEVRAKRDQQTRDDMQAATVAAKDTALAGGAGFDLLSGRHPLLLLPVRLESRFAWMNAGRITFEANAALERVLLVRIYPDEIHEDSHDPQLTAEEVEALTDFRKKLLAVRDLKPLQDLWKELAVRVGATRAGWIGEVAIAMQRPGLRPAKFSRPSIARLLPDRWLAVAELGDGSVVTAASQPVSEPLEMGPSPDGMAWMTDFGKADAAGMAIVLRNLPAGVDLVRRLRVIGVRGTLSPAESQSELEQVLHGHQCTRGFELVAPGTPTNSLPDARSGYRSRPTPEDLVEVNQRRYLIGGASDPLCRQGDDSDGWALAESLGVDVETFAFVRRADATDQRDGRIIRSLLASATQRSLIRHLADVVEPDTVRAVLEFGALRVSALGPLPAFRVGPQPYGVLPVMRRDIGRTRDGSAARQFLPTLERLRGVWEVATANVHRVGRPGVDPDETLIRILQQDAVARRVTFLPFLSRDLSREAARDLDNRGVRALTRQRDIASNRLIDLGFAASEQSALVQALHLPIAPPLTAPLVEPADAAVGSVQLAVTYLELTAGLRVESLFRHEYPGDERPRAFLFAIARLAMLEQADARARELLISAGADPSRWDDEDLPGQFDDFYASMQRRLEAPHPGGPGAIGFHLSEGGSDPQLASLRGMLRDLKARPAAALDEILRASLCLFGSRLDAWYSALAADELGELRRDPSRTTGVHVGAFGILENIRQSPRQPVPGTPGLFTNPMNGGYIHAPSVNQGVAAAVLRSAHLAHSASGHGDAFSVDLTSARVRAGLELAEGIRSGQPLAALLGYRIERELRGEQLARLIAPLRRVAPLVANRLTPSTQPAESVAATNVIDGLTLLADAGYDGQQSGSAATLWARQPSLGAALLQGEQDAFTRVLATAQEGLDALADLALAESVYQLALGNPVRSGGAVDSLSGAPVPPADFSMARTPRSGIGLTHRLMVLLGESSTEADDSGWRDTPRALAEPRLEAWARTILPRPSQITLRARFVDATGAEAARIEETTLRALLESAETDASHLFLGALDVVALADPRDQPQRSGLEQRLAALLDRERPAAAGNASIELVFERAGNWDAATFGIVETLEIAKSLRDLLGQTRALTRDDFGRPGRAAEASFDTAEIADRASAAARTLGEARQGLEDAAKGKPAAIRKALFAAESLGIAGAAPATLRDQGEPDADRRALAQLELQRSAALTEAQRREALVATTPANDPVARLKAIFGEGFTVLPTLLPPTAATDPFQASMAPAGGDESAARTWMARAARVRENVGRLNEVLGHADAVIETVEKGERQQLRVAQIGGAAGERWAALPLQAGTTLPGGRVSMVAVRPTGGLPTRAVAGLLVDEWVEVLPSTEETTSVVFHADAPTSTPPQVLLLGVPYSTQETWTSDDVLEIVDEALALARIRMVDVDALPDLGQLLPLLVTPENPAGDLAGLDVEALTQPETP